jgi:ElaB/YqjD/DUF883 family membrane-anchored ribosome-binding protein
VEPRDRAAVKGLIPNAAFPEGIMFQYRSSAFAPSVSAIQHHLRGVEKELEKIGRIAGRRGADVASTASDQIGDTISDIVNGMLDRFRARRQAAGEQAARIGQQALGLGARYGNSALERVGAEVEDRPFITLGVALGIGILIGAAVLGSTSRR